MATYTALQPRLAVAGACFGLVEQRVSVGIPAGQAVITIAKSARTPGQGHSAGILPCCSSVGVPKNGATDPTIPWIPKALPLVSG